MKHFVTTEKNPSRRNCDIAQPEEQRDVKNFRVKYW